MRLTLLILLLLVLVGAWLAVRAARKRRAATPRAPAERPLATPHQSIAPTGTPLIPTEDVATEATPQTDEKVREGKLPPQAGKEDGVRE